MPFFGIFPSVRHFVVHAEDVVRTIVVMKLSEQTGNGLGIMLLN